MLDAVRKFARRVLLLHLALLIVLVLLIVEAARQVRNSAREQAQTSAQNDLKRVADQTARGIETHYGAILSVLDVFLRDETAATVPAPAASGPAVTGLGRGGRGGRGGGNGGFFGRGRVVIPPRLLTEAVVVNTNTLSLAWRTLREKVSQVVLVDFEAQPLRGGPAQPLQPVQYAYMTLPNDLPSQSAADAIARENLEWLKGIKGAQMSTFKVGADGKGYHLIALPAEFAETQGGGGLGGAGGPGGTGGRGGVGAARGGLGGAGAGGGPVAGSATAAARGRYAVVVVVPIAHVREQFLDPLNSQQEHEVNAMLINDAGLVLTAENLKANSSLIEQIDQRVRGEFDSLVMKEHSEPLATVVNQSFDIAGNKVPPQVMAAAQLELPSGRHWTVLINSPLSEVETVVNQLFGRAAAWAIFVTLSVTAILVSTSFFMIRTRVRLERTQHEMLTRELEQARHIQLAWLPDLKSVPAGIEVSAANLPASHISGDFYNWFALPAMMSKTGLGGGGAGDHADTEGSGRVAVVIGDVTGHGMAAAFLMATTQLLVRMTMSRYQDAGRCLQEVNRQLCMQSGSTFKGQFVTMLVMVLDTRHGTMQVASAGHPMPLVEVEGKIQSLEFEPQLVLGVNPDEEYRAQSYPLEAGASVVLYTDGVVEAEGPTGEQYGVANLMKVLAGKGGDPAHQVQGILADVKRYCGGRELMDDVTLVAIRTGGRG